MISRINISQDNLKHNISALRRLLPDEKNIISVVKANAYGAGLREVVPILEPHTDVFAVDDVDELFAIRFLTEKDVYVLGYVTYEDIVRAIDLNGILVVYDTETLKAVNKAAYGSGRTVEVNVKIDSHLGRQGVMPEDLEQFLDVFDTCSLVNLRGVYSHFANIEDTHDRSHAKKQINGLDEVIEVFKNRGYDDFETHISSTAGTMVYDKDNYDFTHVRLGIGLYGLWPSQDLKDEVPGELELKPVVSWKTKVAQIKTFPKGFSIGYGLTHMTDRETRAVVIPQGYSDGYDRLLSNKGEVLIHGERCPVLGRIAMNMFVVDVTDVPAAALEDEVVLLGKQGEEEITAEEIAKKIDTINYEVIARINPLLKRFVV